MQRNEQSAARIWMVNSVLAALLVLCGVPALVQAQQVPAPRPERLVLVSILDRELVVIENDEVIARFAVAVGAVESPSPTGEFRVVNRVSNPTYYRPGIVIPSGKNNPIGTRWLGLSRKGYGIHGTNAPDSVGRAASHGCIRLRNRDIERLFAMLQIGDRVEIHGERDEAISQFFAGEPVQTIASVQPNTEPSGQ
jgi:lipoprotein-anchoring transpeptidase ErfK/SrfK